MNRLGVALGFVLVVACTSQPAPHMGTPTHAPLPMPTASPAKTASPAGTARPAAAPTPQATEDEREAGWRSDLELLVTLRDEIHPNPWFSISRERYEEAVGEVADQVSEMTDDQLLVEFARLAAMPTWDGHDGHGGIYPWFEPPHTGIHMYPLLLYWFSDGMFVTDALPPYWDLIGARLDAINGHAIDEARVAAEPLIPRDNHGQVLTNTPLLLVTGEVLSGLGLVDDPSAAQEFTLTDGNGSSRIVDVAPISQSQFGNWAFSHTMHSPPSQPDGPLWLRNFGEAAWWQLDEESGLAYMGYNQVNTNATQVAFAIEDAMAAGDVQSLVVDLRNNGGGDNSTYYPILQLVREAAEQMPGRTFVAFGRGTFSAAGNFVTEVERSTDAILVGEDSGTSPNQYGDSRPETLPYSELVLRIALQDIVKSDRDDPRVTVEPDIEALLSSADYFGGRDPVMDAMEEMLSASRN